VAFIFHEDASARNIGWTYWKKAMKLRKSHFIPKTFLRKTKWEKLFII
jgi:hypothetical protein